MRYSERETPSAWSHALLVADILSMKVFVWALGELFAQAVDQNGGVLDSRLFFYDRYSDLAEFHRLKGRTAKAERLVAIAAPTTGPRRMMTNRQRLPRWQCQCRGLE